MKRIWIITGASSGLGRAIAEQALIAGEIVVATVRKAGAVHELKVRFNEMLQEEVLDVTNTKDIYVLVNKVIGKRGRIDVLVNCAGYGLLGATEETTDDELLQQVATNLTAPMILTKAVLPFMRKQRYGRIIQISSMGGQAAFPFGSVYHATKWGLEGFTEGVSQEVTSFGIACIIVEPGGIRTGFGRNAVYTTPMDEYEETIVGYYRNSSVDEKTAFPGDPIKMAKQIIFATGQQKPPLRLVLGSDSFQVVHSALENRIKQIESQKDVAFTTNHE